MRPVVPLALVGILAGAGLASGWGCTASGVSEHVVMWRVPDGGRLPQAVVDDAGTVHLVYFQGEPNGGDLLYVTRTSSDVTWSEPQRVNSEPGTVAGADPISGGRIALGRDNRLHVAWFKMGPTEFFYTRSTQQGTGFEAQFGLAAGNGVEAGPTIAADGAGNVFLFWHAGALEDAHRAVYMIMSHDDGTLFDPVRPVNAEAEGACNCCGLDALTDDAGAVYVSYRGAGDNIRRGQRLLVSRDEGRTFSDELIQPWELGACPVSTTALSQGPTGVKVTWETEGQVYFADVDHLEARVSPSEIAETRRKNPAVAVNDQGATLLVWGDGPGWRSGGALHWQVFGADGQTIEEHAAGTETIPDASRPAALARADGMFLVIF
ncbi:MAG: sialidase family protein [Vicinamibacterales bacterium]